MLFGFHAEFETFEVAKDLDYDMVVLTVDILVPGRVAAHWRNHLKRFRLLLPRLC